MTTSEPTGEGGAVFVGTTQAAARLGVSEKTLGRYVARGLLTPRRTRTNNRLLFALADLDALLAGEPAGTGDRK